MFASSPATRTASSAIAQADSDERGSDHVSDRDFWARLRWDFECFPERYNLVEQHRTAGLDPRDEQYLDTPQSHPQPTRFTSRNGRTVCID